MAERTKQPERRAAPSQPSTRQLKILHLIVTLGHANAQFNEHCLPVRHERDITICSFHPRAVDVPPEIGLFEGDSTVRGFVRALRRALASGPYDIVHAHAPGTAAALVLTSVLSRRSLWNGVLTVHNSRQSFPLRNQALLVPLFAAFPTVVFCSQAAYASFPTPMRSLARTIEVVPNGVDTARVTRAVGGNDVRPTEGFRVVAVGRLIPRKDPLTLVAAFRAMCDPADSLRFVGDGVQRADVLDRAARDGLDDRVVVTGAVEREEVYRQIAGSNVFVTPSHGEGLPVAVLEAMVCGVPVVLSDIPSHREIAASVDFVPLVRPGDVGGFAAAIARVKAMSADERSAIGGGCRALVERRFSLETMQRSYERVYRAVAARRRGRRRVRPTEGEVPL